MLEHDMKQFYYKDYSLLYATIQSKQNSRCIRYISKNRQDYEEIYFFLFSFS